MVWIPRYFAIAMGVCWDCGIVETAYVHLNELTLWWPFGSWPFWAMQATTYYTLL